MKKSSRDRRVFRKADRDRIVIVIWQRNPKWIEKNYKQGALF